MMSNSNYAGYLPVLFDVGNKQCLVVGGGKVAFRKITVLRKFLAKVTCLSKEFIKPIEVLNKAKKIRCVKACYPAKMSLAKYALVVAATNDARVNKKIARDAKRDKVLVNVVDKSEPGSIIMPAILKIKGLTIGVSTGGRSPRYAKKIRDILRNAL